MLKRLLCNERGEVTVTEPTTEPVAPPAAVEPAVEPAAPAAEPTAEPASPEAGLKAALKAERQKRQELAEQLAYFKGKADATSTPTTVPAPATSTEPQAPVRPVKPQADQFSEWSEFEAAEARYEADLEKYHEEHTKFVVDQEITARAGKVRQQEAQQRAVQSFKERLDKAAETDPELLNIVANYHIPASPYHVPMNDAMVDVITESEVGPEMIRALANDTKLAARIAGMTPLAAAREMGKIEAKLATPAPPPPRVSQAPEPVTTITPVGAVKEFDPETAPMDEYYRTRMAQMKRR